MSDDEPVITKENSEKDFHSDHVLLCGEHSNGKASVNHSGPEPTDFHEMTPPNEEG